VIDETAFRTALRGIADGAVVGPEPAAAARRRAGRIRRRRLVGAVGATVAAIAVATAVPLAVGSGQRAVTNAKPVFGAATAPTSALVTVRSARSGPYTLRTVIYWHGSELCQAIVGAVGVAPATCPTSTSFRYGLGLPFGEATISGVIGSPRIASVNVRYDDGVIVPARIVSGAGFPNRAYVAVLRSGHFVVEVAGYDARGRHVASHAMDQATPAWPLGLDPASAVALVGPQRPATARHGARQTVVYWHASYMCVVVVQLPEQVSDYGCDKDNGHSGWVVKGTVGMLGGSEGFAAIAGEPSTARVVATLFAGGTRRGVRATGYGFAHPVFVFPVPATAIERLDTYDAKGHHLGRKTLHWG
jgi:hypothetical protein